jgi:hypothetical protein
MTANTLSNVSVPAINNHFHSTFDAELKLNNVRKLI